MIKNPKSKDEDKTQKDAVVMTEPSPLKSDAGLYQLKGKDLQFFSKNDKTKMNIKQINDSIPNLVKKIDLMKKKQATADDIKVVVDGLVLIVQNDLMKPELKKKTK